MKVDFMIIGAQKCGTTTLFDILKTHPSIIGSRKKEPDFFSTTDDWKKHVREYEHLFEESNDAIYFEASTSYTFYPHLNLNIWDDIYEYNPAMKFIYIVRNPIDRIISSYMHTYERGYTDKSVYDLICRDNFLISVSRYYTQILPYITRFGLNKVLILDFDDVVRNTNEIIIRISTFLGIDYGSFGDIASVHSNASLSKRRIHHRFDNPSRYMKLVKTLAPAFWEKLTDNSSRTFAQKPDIGRKYREVILRMLLPEIQPLEELVGKDLSSWYKDLPTLRAQMTS